MYIVIEAWHNVTSVYGPFTSTEIAKEWIERAVKRYNKEVVQYSIKYVFHPNVLYA